jgi:hypothetical protein
MPYGTIYRLSCRYDHPDYYDETIIIDISDNDSFTDDPITPTVYTLTGAETPFRVNTVDNDRDKTKPIRAKAAEINFIAEYNTDASAYVNAQTFAVGADNRWIVSAIIQSTGFNLFTGFLVMDDHSQPFMPVSHGYTVRLTATDNLGTLGEIDHTDFDGNYVRGKDTLLNHLLYALAKTNLGLNVVITSTWFEESQTAFECAWQNIYADGKAFEAEIGKAIDPYTVIEMIMKTFFCSLTQYDGKWWVNAIDERTGTGFYRFEFEADGTHVADFALEEFNETVGINEVIKLAHEDALITYSRQHKETVVEVKYEKPLEIIDNMDFSRGIDYLSPISVDMGLFIQSYANLGAFPSTGEFGVTYKANDTSFYYKWNTASLYEQVTGAEIPTGEAYAVEDWTIGRYTAANMTPTATAVGTYIAKIFKYGNEDGRHLVIGHSTETTPFTYIRSNPIPVGRNDKGVISVDFRQNAAVNGSGNTSVFAVVLEGETGSNYVGTTLGIWNPATSYGSSNFAGFSFTYTSVGDKIKWQTATADLPPFPESGNLYILLIAGYGVTSNERHYSNLQFDYHQFVNGSYQKYTGHSHTVSQDGDYKARLVHEMPLGDSPRPILKRSLFKEYGSRFVLTERWYAAGDLLNQAITPPIPDEYLKPLGKMLAFALWNQHNRQFKTISGSFYGLDLNATPPDMVHTFSIEATTTEVDIAGRQFMLTSREITPATNDWSGELVEVYGEDKVYDDDYTFKYEQK